MRFRDDRISELTIAAIEKALRNDPHNPALLRGLKDLNEFVRRAR